MRVPPFHWWRTVVFLIPAISVYTIVLRHLIEQRADWSWCAIQITDKKARG